MKYLVLVEKSSSGFGATAPDLPGCTASGYTLDETLELMHGSIEMHLELMREQGMPVPEPSVISIHQVEAA